MWKTLSCSALLLATAVLVLSGCGDRQAEGKTTRTAHTQADEARLPDGLFVDTAPEGGVDVAKAKEEAKEGDVITLRAQIGGREEPFATRRASVTVCDVSVKPCVDGMDCSTPWDMCCDSTALAKSVSVQVNDADGKPLKVGLKGKGGLQPLTTIVVKGKVGPRPDKNAFVLHAEKIFIEKKGMPAAEQ